MNASLERDLTRDSVNNFSQGSAAWPVCQREPAERRRFYSLTRRRPLRLGLATHDLTNVRHAMQLITGVDHS
jgi:hypothetical protein